MKNLKGLSIVLFISLFALQLNAQSRPGAKKVDKAEEASTVQVPPVEEKQDPAVISKPETETNSKPEKEVLTTDEGTVKPAPRPKQKTETVAVPVSQESSSVKNDKRAQRMHAEERSNGNAFSGKGKGGDKNLIDPVKRDKQKSKKKKKIKSEKIKK